MGLFDKLSEGVVKGLGQTERVLDIGRLKSQIDLVARQRDEAITALGRAVYRAHRENRFSDPEFAGAIEQIRDMEVSLGRLEGEVEALRAQSSKYTCPSCGALSASDAKFCIGCGRVIVREETRPCPSCGAAVGIEAAFCGRCGTGIEPVEPSLAPVPAATLAPDDENPAAPAPEETAGAVATTDSGHASGRTCTSCGHLGEPDERFCGACGSAMVS